MPTPELEPSWIARGLDWAWAIVSSLLVTCWSFLKADINRAHTGNTKALEHIEKLYNNAEFDRRFTRDLYDKAVETQRLQHAEIVRLITAEGARRR